MKNLLSRVVFKFSKFRPVKLWEIKDEISPHIETDPIKMKLMGDKLTNVEERIPKNLNKLGVLQNVKSDEILKSIDSSLENYFKERKVSLANFNLLLHVLSVKRDYESAVIAFEKMSIFNIKPNVSSYANMIVVSGKSSKISEAEIYFNEATNLFGQNKVLYNSMIYAYSRVPDLVNAETTWNQAIRSKIVPDCAMLTSMVSVCLKTRDFKKAWEFFAKRKEFEIEPDDVLLGNMIRICSLDSSAEKAKIIFEDIKKLENVRLTCLHYNSLLKALSTRKDYSKEAITLYKNMISDHIKPDSNTFVALLMATSKIGDIAESFNAMTYMTKMKIKPNKYIFTLLFKTYAAALKTPQLDREIKDLYIEDSWNLLIKFLENQMEYISTPILNSLLQVYVSADKGREAENLVLPLYKQYNLALNQETHRTLIEYYFSKRELVRVKQIFETIKNIDGQLCVTTLNIMIETFMRTREIGKIEEVFEKFIELELHPGRFVLSQICAMKNIPDRIYDLLMKFDYSKQILSKNKRTYENKSLQEKEQEKLRKMYDN